MERDKLNQIITERNEKREREAKCQASDIIEYIAAEQAKIKHANTRIAELRKELKELSIDTINESELLGEDE